MFPMSLIILSSVWPGVSYMDSFKYILVNHSFIYSTKMYLVSAIIRIALDSGNILTIKEIPTLVELLFSLQTQVDKMDYVLVSLSLELRRKDKI